MSHSLLFKHLFERKQVGQPHYIRKWSIKNAKPTGLTDAQRAIAAPPHGGEPAAPVYAFFDISKYKPDWQPGVIQIVKRPELNTEYAQLDNGFWYLLEEGGGYVHMTDKEFKDFLAWKMDRDQREEEDDETEEGSDDHDDEELLAEFDAAEEAPDPSLEMLNSEIGDMELETEKIDPELRDSK
ncbi:hypothetical protein GE21DRAFT_2434 [Neurospora crassa]|uniref:Uncharacterized protein n=2 Tax=Neurospora crassa TaxID=5141 RepID=Q7SDD2_NEUCR|nr:hypothetical protein NCU02860 [Neurospora crassa OR74A]EAA34758.1 hypothetical protein NCU02860 [Neurospora crassa OR74A]KHE78686.1 hypothetical protein GE21DRAFT_2434 [Neurospora crassa]CAE76224.1 hypothetical protein [Neurospora crassa]|eukprot:XP_963994.1 hypothetical protein NCU02860 [Neurospora crassa OR74A]